MLKATKRTLAAAAVIAAASAPSTAYARFNLDPEPSAAHPQAPHIITPAHAEADASSPGRFQWGDAGLGAAGTLALLGVGAGSTVVLARRRGHQTRVS